MAVTEQIITKAEFRKIGTDAKPLFASEQGGNYAQSMKSLADNGLRPLTYKEALSFSSELIAELKGKWFFLEGGVSVESGMYTFNEKGELRLSNEELLDQKVHVYSGSKHSRIGVCDEEDTVVNDARFILAANGDPSRVASAVVGLEIGHKVDGFAGENALAERLRGLCNRLEKVIETGELKPRLLRPMAKEAEELLKAMR